MAEEIIEQKPNIILTRQEDQELRIYFFIGEKAYSLEKKTVYVAGFKLEDAFELAKIKGDGFSLLYTLQNPTVREFLHELDLEALAYQALKEKPYVMAEKPEGMPTSPLDPVQMTFEKFRSGLLFCVNEKDIVYEKPEDQETLERIITGLRYNPS